MTSALVAVVVQLGVTKWEVRLIDENMTLVPEDYHHDHYESICIARHRTK